MAWSLNALLACILVSLTLAYGLLDIRFKYALFIPVNSISVFLYFEVKNYVDEVEISVAIKTVSRLTKFCVAFLLFYTTISLIPVGNTHVFIVCGCVLLVMDLVRAYLYESSKRSFENKILTGYFMDILKLEKYIIYSTEGSGCVDLSKNLTVDEYFSRGRPKPIAIDDLFCLWNDQNPYAELSSESEAVEEESTKRRVRRRWRVSVNPESYRFDDDGTQRDIQDIEKVEMTQDEERREKTFVMDQNEILSDTEVDFHEETGIDLNGERWRFLEAGENNMVKTATRPGLITVESLEMQFGEEHAKEVYNLIVFSRGENINYNVFKENGRQINNERNNLYRTIQGNRNLLQIIWIILTMLEGVFSYFVVATYLKTQPLLLELIIPLLFVPALPILKVTLEAFLFIIYTHPYDPGDRVHIEGENMVVRKISLFYTTLDRWDGAVITIPNLVIKDKAISNIRRSRAQQWKLEILISSKTPDRKLELLREAIRRFVKNNKVYISASVNINDIVDSTHIKMRVIVKHASNFQSGFFMWTNHTKFASMLVTAMHLLNIKFKPLDMDVIDMSNSIKAS